MVFLDKKIYEGEWKDGSPNGEGSLILTDGTTYKGNFKNSKYDSKRSFISQNK